MRMVLGACAALAVGSAASAAEPLAVGGLFPIEAAKRGLSGRAVVSCQVGPNGELAHCVAVSETPPGVDFGVVAAVMASRVRLSSPSAGGQVRVPVTFRWEKGAAGIEAPSIPPDQPVPDADPRPPLQPDEVEWLGRPTGQDMARYYPPKAQRRNLSGFALGLCRVGTEGVLRGCRVVADDPPGFGFGAALVKLFDGKAAVGPMTKSGEPTEGRQVLVKLTLNLVG